MNNGIYLPIITPFSKDQYDRKSYKKLIDAYVNTGIVGIIPLGTTGEVPTISDKEAEAIVSDTIEFVDNRVDIIVGRGGNCTQKVVEGLKKYENAPIQGFLSVGPYYNRPSEEGIYEHFKAIAGSTDHELMLYNIPYRTGRNMSNLLIHRLAEISNIVALKDASGDLKQTTDLLLNRPENFKIFTGEDYFYYHAMVLGADGGVLASAHLNTDIYLYIYQQIQLGHHHNALKAWKDIANSVSMLFEEPNPAPIKYCLYKLGLIESDEVRLPLTTVTKGFSQKLDTLVHSLASL